jgi:broad specificity phosphatase PhoE
MSLRLYFLRHGETPYSKTGGYCGSLDPELTPEGLEMADAFASVYRHTKWDAVYVSPMKRTISTAKPLCDAVGIEMQLKDGLKEINYGEWEGQTNEFVKQNYHDTYVRWLTEPAWNPPTSGETSVQIASRVMPVISEIEEKYTDGNVLIVSHKATIRIILCNLMGIDIGRYRDRINVLVASINIVKFDEHGPLLEVLGDRNHLPEHLRNLKGT